MEVATMKVRSRLASIAGVAVLMSIGSGAADAAVSKPFAYVVGTSPGPLVACPYPTPLPTPASCSTQHYIYVVNPNQLVGRTGVGRTAIPGAYVVSSIDETVLIDGTPYIVCGPPACTWNAPGTPGSQPFHAGHWPATVLCSAPGSCQIGKPAALPGENVVMFYIGWGHGSTAAPEPPGTYVFEFTLHGVLNDGTPSGTPLDLTVRSQPIVMN
jgi:hypothetical protein